MKEKLTWSYLDFDALKTVIYFTGTDQVTAASNPNYPLYTGQNE